MCGITGLYLNGGEIDKSRLQRSAQTLKHRGPDDLGNFVHGAFGMAHTRLSIIDLSGGHQPLFARSNQLALIANGEIYNHVELRADLERLGHCFATHSDCEAILHAYVEYGDDFLNHLHGMFAFALYDIKQRRLVLARDRLGIKPLFLAHLPKGLGFGSELKALLPLCDQRPEINAAGLAEFLQNQFSSGRTTIFKGIERILPGEAVCIERGHVVKRWRYWSALHVKPSDTDFDDAQNRFDELMATVMQQHMRSDVPYGLFLSGGVDSAILLALLNRYTEDPIRTFSVGFENTRLTDELPMARTIAQRFPVRHSEIRPSRDAIFQCLPYTVWAADDLMRDNANLPTNLLAHAAGQEVKVVFSGEGGDEVFAGYGRYRTSRLERWLKATIAPGSGGFRTSGTFSRNWPRALFTPELLNAAQKAREPFISAWQETPRVWSELQRMQYTDLVTALPDNLLVKADRMLMGWGVEGRVPFLDHRVVEFGLALPDRLKVEGKQGKAFLKRWATRFLPKEHLYGRKRGFYVPVGEWLQGDYLARLKTVLPHHPAISAWFQPKGVKTLLDQYQPTGPSNRMVWALLQFALWHQLFIEGSGERPPDNIDPLEFIGL